MEIRLKETEIRAAVIAYIGEQGINLDGKTVDVKFIATRSDAGIVAEIDISNATVGGTGAVIQATMRPVVAEVTIATLAAKDEMKDAAKEEAKEVPKTRRAADIDVKAVAEAAKNAVIEAGTEAEEAVAAAADTATPKATTSLFGS